MRHPQLHYKDVDASVRILIDAMINTLVQGSRVEVRGFGSFSLTYRPPRKGRNPKNGMMVMIPAKYLLHFRAALELRQRVDNLTT